MFQSLWYFMSVMIQITLVTFVQILSLPLPEIFHLLKDFSSNEKWAYLEIQTILSQNVRFFLLFFAFIDIKLVVCLSYFS